MRSTLTHTTLQTGCGDTRMAAEMLDDGQLVPLTWAPSGQFGVQSRHRGDSEKAGGEVLARGDA